MKILVVNGPNLNMLGKRETSLYGCSSMRDIEAALRLKAQDAGLGVDFFQSNH